MSRFKDLTSHDWDAIFYLGGWENCRHRVDGILRKLGESRSLLGDPPEELCDKLVVCLESSITSVCASLFNQAASISRNFRNTKFKDCVLLHFVEAIIYDKRRLEPIGHRSYLTLEQSPERIADFHVNNVAIHVTTHPSEALMRKAAANLRAGLKPLIITLADGVSGAHYLLKGTEWADRVDVLDISQFLTANVYERSLFHAGECKLTLKTIIERYNEIVSTCETDPVLLIRC